MTTEISDAKENIEKANLPTSDNIEAKNFSIEYDKAVLLIKQIEQQIKGEQDVFDMRKYWSIFIIRVIAFLVLSQIGLIILLGFGHYIGFNLTEYRAVVMAFFIQTFVQIIGLAILVVAFLFNKINPNSKNL